MQCSGNCKSLLIISVFILAQSCQHDIKKETFVVNQIDNQKNLSQQEYIYPYKIFSLNQQADYTLEEKFRNTVDVAWEKTYDNYSLRFNYSIVPEGVIYPYSKVKVLCITDSKNIESKKFNEACNDFFRFIEENLKKIKGSDKNEDI